MAKNHEIHIPLWWIGLILTLFAAYLLWDKNLFGTRTIGIAITSGVVGIALLATSKRPKLE